MLQWWGGVLAFELTTILKWPGRLTSLSSVTTKRVDAQEACRPAGRAGNKGESMPQNHVEVILMRQLASYLSMPILVVDPAGTLLFYNEPAEALLGRRFEENGALPRAKWAPPLPMTADNGSPLPPEARPLSIALQQQRATHGGFWIQGFDGISRRLEVTAFPLAGQGGRQLGAVAIFWEGRES